METNWRSIVKTVTWRLTGSSATFAVSYAIVGSFAVSSTIALVQLTLNTVLYYIHERIWSRIAWGQQNEIE